MDKLCANHSISVVSIYLQLENFLFSKLCDQVEHWGSSTAISWGYPVLYTYIITITATLQKRKTIFCSSIFTGKEKNYSYHKFFQKFQKKKKKHWSNLMEENYFPSPISTMIWHSILLETHYVHNGRSIGGLQEWRNGLMWGLFRWLPKVIITPTSES